jgi:pimeloyl-ACP methyl ester carboxylesterase
MSPHTAGRAAAVGAVLVFVAFVAACGTERRAVEGVAEHETEGTFYTVPSPLPAGAPGSLIRADRLLGAPDGSIAWRVLYRSTDVTGASIGVSGIVVAPTGPAPAGGRPVVAWAHPTTGAVGRCAPSVGVDPFLTVEGLHELLDAGYAIAATDYPGMGADGPPSYLIGVSEGNSVLDAARAARAIPEAEVGDQLILWGHSQGGQAALFAAQGVRQYAPDLDLLGVAVAAPAAELGQLLDDDIGDESGVTIGAYAFDAYQRVYGAQDASLQLSSILSPEGVAAIPQMVPLCLLTQNKELHDIAGPLVGRFLIAAPTTTEPWATLLRQNTPGGQPIGVPMLVAQGEADTLVKPATTAQYVQHLCATGEHVQYDEYRDVDHGLVAYRTIPALLPWIAELIGGRTPSQNCSTAAATTTTT